MENEEKNLVNVLEGISDVLERNLQEISEKLSKIENELSALSRTQH